MKIAVLGYSGSGKSTLAAELGAQLGCPVLHLDTLQFLPGWVERDREEARALAADFLDRERAWVIDGNYTGFHQARRLAEAERIILLDFPRRVCLPRVVRRYLRNRGRSRESMAPGCVEKLDWAFLRWVLWEGRTPDVRRHYREIAAQYPEKTAVLRSPRQVQALLAALDKTKDL